MKAIPGSNDAYLLIGGNQGNREATLREARRRIETEAGPITAVSSIYETEAWGKTDQPAFLNQALSIETALGAEALLQSLLSIERALGRVRAERYAPRTIDIDILFFNASEIHSAALDVPHPEIARRRFVLAPLAEIAPKFLHPVTGLSVEAMLAACADPLAVKKWGGRPEYDPETGYLRQE